ncbi:lysophospholipid acyltransferase family protein [Planktosalinus lacus]|uniref:1-acyl-sn-glycerol-3-phosphate acyltransferase n=1 Tax=Planktosalinus lacus TaxID=1526573 RepID=A0A8J2V6W9_9FLAO|nr:lysophospholipid acyltransferase family protein [Planktosalinus lacus]GGD79749.1 1-acyl-sn-glycerol-3-phosphate acyltransferase [Planktosalinus lacus]
MFLKTYVFIPIWRVWFYILIALTIVILFPFLLVSISKKEWYPQFFVVARVWATMILFGMGFFPKIKKEEEPDTSKSYMFVANHTSMTDIMLMLYAVKNPFVFVGKKELAKIPLFGFFYKRTCILVDRNNAKSRKEVFDAAQQRIHSGLSICIFPEGGVPEDETILLDTFKDGAFRLAIDHQIPIVPMTFHDNKKRFPYTFLSGGPGLMRVKSHRFVHTINQLKDDKKNIKEVVRNTILNELQTPSI